MSGQQSTGRGTHLLQALSEAENTRKGPGTRDRAAAQPFSVRWFICLPFVFVRVITSRCGVCAFPPALTTYMHEPGWYLKMDRKTL